MGAGICLPKRSFGPTGFLLSKDRGMARVSVRVCACFETFLIVLLLSQDVTSHLNKKKPAVKTLCHFLGLLFAKTV